MEKNYLNLYYVAKNRNGGKLSSHFWFFSGFCEIFQPDYTILIDCGLKPFDTAVFNMFRAMESDL